MTTVDHDKAIAAAARRFVAAHDHIHSPHGTWSTKEGVALGAAVEAEEKAKEPQLMTAEEAQATWVATPGSSRAAFAAVLTEAHRRAAARAEWALVEDGKLRSHGLDGDFYSFSRVVVRKALTSQE